MNDVEANKYVVKRLFAAFGEADISQIVDLLHDQAEWWVSGSLAISGTYSKAEMEKLLVGMHELVDGAIKLTPTGFVTEGDRVAVEAESLANTKSGRVYNNRYHFLFEIKDGKVFRVKEYMDPMHVHAVFFEA